MSIFSKKQKIVKKSSKTSRFFARLFRFLTYMIGKVAAIVAVYFLIKYAFITAQNSSNVFMIGRDAFAKRTSVILNPVNNPDKDLLKGIFTDDYLRKTNLINQQKNGSYVISSYDLQTSVPVSVVWGWLDSFDVKVKNIVQDFEWKFDKNQLEINEVDEFIESGEYTLHFVKTEQGIWLIDDITLDNKIDIPDSHPTPFESEVMEDVHMATETSGTAEEDDT